MTKRILIFAVASILFFGCKKEKVAKSTNISNAQAATMVATALSVNANGFASIKNDITTYAKGVTNAGKGCGVIDSFAVARQDAESNMIDFNYAVGYYYVVNCVNNGQDNLTANVIYTGSFDASTLSAVNSVNSSISLASLAGAPANYTLNGNYSATGTFQTTDLTQLTGNNTISIDIKSLVVDRATKAIVSGAANVAVSGMVKNKNSFGFSGTLVFKDANTAVLTLEGTSYSLNITTADVTSM